MKNKFMVALLAPLLLGGCFGLGGEKPVLTKTVLKVVEIEEKYYECDKVQLPDLDTLDDARIAKLINDLVKANRVCYNNMNAIKLYTEAAKKVLEAHESN